jgi:GalNAc-alpha-(1->4)-GalNAc-alpha-(1->3)-diNAcBac-PP-undecaprenol alpha-1,4-N-acetyl-D-galactosaminyltransferase
LNDQGDKKPSILMVIMSLGGGGAERICTLMAGGLAGRGYPVSIVTLDNPVQDAYPLYPAVQRHRLDLGHGSSGLVSAFVNNARRVKQLRRRFRESAPDLVISFIDEINILSILAAAPLNLPVIATQRADPSMYDSGPVWSRLRRYAYPKAACVMSISAGVDRFFSWIPEERREVIHNPLAPQAIAASRQPPPPRPDRPYMVAMGRLVDQKGFDLLLQAFAKIAGKHPDVDLKILGEGENRKALESQRAELGLDDRVLMPGRIDDPFPVLRAASLFVLSSRTEGFGNVLTEAMVCGLPVLSTDCPSGPTEIIRDGEDGIIVPSEDVEALASAMDRLMSDENERRRLGAAAEKAVLRFSLDAHLDRWEKLIGKVLF